MKLEDEIKVKSFRNELHKLNVNLIYTYNWLMGETQSRFTSFGVTMQQFNVLRILRGQHPKPCTIQLLKDRMLDKQSDASRLVDRLVAKKLVDRQSNSEDRRKMDVIISDKGLELLAKMDPVVTEIDDLMGGISEQEAMLVNDALDRLRDKGHNKA